MMDETKFEETTNQEPVPGAPGAVLGQNEQPAAASGAETGAETVAEEAAPNYLARIGELESTLAEERDRAAKLLDQSQRMAAEFQNSRRRLETQVQDEIERASIHLLRRLLPVMDDFDLAFAHVPASAEAIEGGAAWVEGFRQIQKKLHAVLADEGVEVIRGEGEFDPTLHEAVSGEPSDDVPSGHIIGTLRGGYTYKGKVLRPALVRVAM